MNNKEFGMILRKLRTTAELSVRDVTTRLSAMGIELSEKTLYGYEKGIRMPNADMLIYLCQIYRCSNILSVFTGADDTMTYPEIRMVENYRSLDPHGRAHVDTILGWETERMRLWTEQLRRLSREAGQTAEQQAEDQVPADGAGNTLSGTNPSDASAAKDAPDAPASLWTGSRARNDRPYSVPTPFRTITYLHRMASAGSGEFLFDDLPTDIIQIRATPLSEHADFVIGVNGDSMEPTYSDGDMVLVEKTPEISIGEIGIFIRGGDCFIKEAGENCLISHNKNYPDIPPSEEIRVIGRVLGRIEA